MTMIFGNCTDRPTSVSNYNIGIDVYAPPGTVICMFSGPLHNHNF